MGTLEELYRQARPDQEGLKGMIVSGQMAKRHYDVDPDTPYTRGWGPEFWEARRGQREQRFEVDPKIFDGETNGESDVVYIWVDRLIDNESGIDSRNGLMASFGKTSLDWAGRGENPHYFMTSGADYDTLVEIAESFREDSKGRVAKFVEQAFDWKNQPAGDAESTGEPDLMARAKKLYLKVGDREVEEIAV